MPLYKHVANAWNEMRPSTWQLFNGLTFPFIAIVMLLTEESFNKLPGYAAMREWASIHVWSMIFITNGLFLLLTRVGSRAARLALFCASLLWLTCSVSIWLAVGWTAFGPPIYLALALFTARTFVKSKGFRSVRLN